MYIHTKLVFNMPRGAMTSGLRMDKKLKNVCLKRMMGRYASRQTGREYICGFNRKSMGIETNLLFGASGVDVFDDVATVFG